MPRKFSLMNPQQVREELECGLHDAKKLVTTSRLLDLAENAETVEQLRQVVVAFIKMQTGVQ